MKKRKKEVFSTCLSMLENDLKLLEHTPDVLNQDHKFIANFKMYTSSQELTWDVTPVINLVRFEGKELLVKMLRSIHHDFSVLNIQEMTIALNNPKLRVSTFSEAVPNQLYIIKALADSIEEINPVTQ